MKDELVKETHDSLGMSRRTLPATVKSTLSIRHMFGAFKPAVDSVPTESDSQPNPLCGRHTSNEGNRSELAYHPYIVLWGILHISSRTEERAISYHGLPGCCFLDRRIGRHLEQGRIHQRSSCLDLQPAFGIRGETRTLVHHQFCISAELYEANRASYRRI
jgi:hypothetical protein